MHIGHGRLRVCLSVRRRIPTLLHGPGCKLGVVGGAVLHCWADLQSVHGFAIPTAPNAKCQRVRACTRSVSLYVWLVLFVFFCYSFIR